MFSMFFPTGTVLLIIQIQLVLTEHEAINFLELLLDLEGCVRHPFYILHQEKPVCYIEGAISI